MISGKQFEFDTLFQGNSVYGEVKGRARRFGQLNLYQVGELSCMSGYVVPPHKQWCHEISYVIGGEGVFTTDNDINLLVEGDIHFAPANSIHTIETVNNSDLRYAYIGFSFNDDDTNEEMKKLREFFESTRVFKASDHSELIIPIFRNLDELYNRADYYPLMVETYLLQILISVYRTLTTQRFHEYIPAKSDHSVGRAVYSVIKYIDNHIYEKIGVQEIADRVGYNYSYISSTFRQKTGMTIQRYICNRKIEKAIELIKYANLSVTQVSEKLGYANLQSFNKAFKRTMGCAPTEFIKKSIRSRQSS